MKKSIITLSVISAAMLACVSCSNYIETPASPDDTFTLTFNAEVSEPSTKASLTTSDEKTFSASWKDGDEMTVSIGGKSYIASWSETGHSFSIENVPNDYLGKTIDVIASYPATTPSEPVRTQVGASYNSLYDTMIGSCPVSISAEGKTIIPMTRTTAILYFHVSGGSSEDSLESATLTVGDQTINASYTGQTTDDAYLWFNIEPVEDAPVTLVMRSTSGATATISRKTNATYEAAQLYTVIKTVSWEENDSSDRESIEDNILISSFGSVSANGYNTYSSSGLTATYQGYFMKSTKNGEYPGGDIQMRAKSSTKEGSYLVSKTSSGYVSQIEASWISHPTSSNNPLTVYGSNSPFSESDYYNDIAKGEILGSVSVENPNLIINGSYQYFGLIATGGAYVGNVKVTWSSTPIPTKTSSTISAKYSEVLNVGEDNEYDVQYNGDGILSIESSDEDVAEAIIEGNSVIISANGKGSTTITISAPATENYTSAKLEYELVVTGAQTILYKLETQKNSSNTAYATYYDVTINELSWSAPGNQGLDGYWRIGGKQIDKEVRSITGKEAIAGNVDRVVINTNGKSNNSLTVHDVRLIVSSDKSFSSIVSQMSGTLTDLSKIQFDRPADASWNSCYYKIEFELTNSTTKNYGIDLTSVEFFDL